MAAALTLDDLPQGFQEMSAEGLSDMQQDLSKGAIAFGFGDQRDENLVMGQLVPFTTRIEQATFDAMLPDLIDVFPAVFGASTTPETIPGLDDVGVSRAGSTFVTGMLNFTTRWDIVVFRRGEIGVFLSVAHNEGSGSALNIADIAHFLDERFINFLGINPLVFGGDNVKRPRHLSLAS